MQYRVSVTVSWSNAERLVTHISAPDLTAAECKVAEYNGRHPEWDLRLLKAAPERDDARMSVYLIPT